MLTRIVLFATGIALPAAGALVDTAPHFAAVPAAVQTTQQAPATDIVPTDQLYFTTIDVDAMMRAPVTDTDGRIVGSVAELGVSGTGRIVDATVRLTGGPLGLTGERVTLSFDDLKVERTGQLGVDSFVIHADLTGERIRALADEQV